MLRFKINDKVIVISGKDRGKIAVISKVIKKINSRTNGFKFFLKLEGVNLLSKHVKPMPNKNKSGGIIKIEAPISFSNVALLNPITEKKDKVYFKLFDNRKKIRVFRSNGEVLS